MYENEFKNIQVLNPIQGLKHRSLQFLEESLEWKSHGIGLGEDCAIKTVCIKLKSVLQKWKKKQ